ncbi:MULTISPECIES: hypothetical protein [unclassified Pseudomonas]|jgi:hypothetical protein|uniref:Uncharacterized protein n=1 Tax=Pseudomonas gorinensis TaxID=3240790 RepID=A0ACA7PCU0_9PSED|nr:MULTISPECIES: hypothetical protein [unclassified Pseudomonas]AHC37755.1 hypothetical protein U771_26385 [Pseudomonas sp. TKP]MBL1311507.1 hypothetical protein [Pseudomonas sp.]PMX17458.1 hypothetical protein C1Y25_05110 [Pseudomonas sp. MPBC4-3]PMX49892.1 hypothetical protein C1Y20_04985 [Pseudomonas sp. FW301-21B01]PMY10564.1 hypothetical protein C1Y18_02815 [Pseudomonas sp. MPR-R5A]
MELQLEAVALFSHKLAYETEGESPILRDDPIMSEYEREVFGLLVRNGEINIIQQKLDECLAVALSSLGGVNTVMGRELQRLTLDVRQASTLHELNAPLNALKDYLKAIQ